MCTHTGPLHRLLAAGVLALAAACTTGRTRAPAATAGAASTARPDPFVISREEITRVQFPNVYTLVEVLRPRWLVLRGRDTLGAQTQIRAYLGTTRLSGNIETLRELPVAGITRVEFVDPVSAAARWGLDHSQGAIVVSAEAP